MFQIPTRIKPAYNAENIFALNKTTSHPNSFLQNPAPHHQPDIPVSQPVSPEASVPEKHNIPVLRNIIQKGQKVRIGMVGQLPRIRVTLGWNVSNVQCDIDLSAYLLDASGKVPGDNWFVFYGQTLSPDRSVALHINESSSDREYADIDFFRLDPSIRKIVFVLTINEALERNLNFSMVQDAYIRILNPDSGQEIYSFMLTDYYDNVTSMMLGEIYLHNTEWKFNAIGNGVARDLAGLCRLYGVETS